MIPKDPAMLLSWANLKLRDEYSSLDELCKAELIDQAELENSLISIDYRYDTATNRFI